MQKKKANKNAIEPTANVKEKNLEKAREIFEVLFFALITASPFPFFISLLTPSLSSPPFLRL